MYASLHLNQIGGFSRSLANSATDWPRLLLELLSAAFEIDYFQVYFSEIQVSFLVEYCRRWTIELRNVSVQVNIELET